MNKIKQLRDRHQEVVSERITAIKAKESEQTIQDIEDRRMEIWRELMKVTNEYFETYDDLRVIRIINNSRDE